MNRPTAYFDHNGTDWSASRAAESYIRERGWSIGPTDITGVRGVICEPDVVIAKWKNLTPTEQAQCDGQLHGRGRDTDRTLYIDLAQIARTHRQQSAIGAQPRAVCNHTEDGQPYCAQPECDVDWCQDCGDEYSEPCARHENAGRP